MAFIENKQKLVQLTYTFIFSRRDNIWNNIGEFENDLSKFFAHKGLESEPIIFVDGSSGNRTLYITDSSKNMFLRNDKQLMQPQNLPKGKPSSSYTTTKKLVSRIEGSK